MIVLVLPQATGHLPCPASSDCECSACSTPAPRRFGRFQGAAARDLAVRAAAIAADAGEAGAGGGGGESGMEDGRMVWRRARGAPRLLVDALLHVLEADPGLDLLLHPGRDPAGGVRGDAQRGRL